MIEITSQISSRITTILVRTDVVGMWINEIMKGKSKSEILRYNHKGQFEQTIPHIVEHEPFKRPAIITKNNNGDIVVADSMMPVSVVAIDREGNNRFYRGHPEHQKR